ncbi:MAG TPA: matrixin family metalloprotease [Candidatus Nitrosotalea sp.]|nr:matrixin family metalloprotease [Candidatus Nitrosotalea sp.]
MDKNEIDKSLQTIDPSNGKKIRNLEQRILLLRELKNKYKQKISKLEDELTQIKQVTETEIHKERESSQMKMLSQDIVELEHRKNIRISKKFYMLIALTGIAVAIGFTGYSYYEEQVVLQTMTNVLTNYKTGYLIQNLQGTTINTWVSWNIPPDRILHVDIVNQAGVPQDKIDAVKDAILSKTSLQIDDSLIHEGPKGTTSTYYMGWQGALAQASKTSTQLYIPKQFEISESSSGSGDIIIILSSDINPDGYTGFTKSVSDQHQILRSTVTIFQAQNLSINQLKAIARHEFGHAMGLAHSTDPNDVMHATIQTQYPYISGCDILAINRLYNGAQSSQVACQ